MEISPIKPLLANSKFADKADEIDGAFSAAGVTTLSQLDNAPRVIGNDIAGYSIYQITAFIREAVFDRIVSASEPESDVVEPEPELEPEPEPEPELEPESEPILDDKE